MAAFNAVEELGAVGISFMQSAEGDPVELAGVEADVVERAAEGKCVPALGFELFAQAVDGRRGHEEPPAQTVRVGAKNWTESSTRYH